MLDRRGRQALLVLEDGTVLPGRGLRRGGGGSGGGRLQHGYVRLPGDPHRSLLQGTDRRDDLPADRQYRDQPGRHGVGGIHLEGFVIREYEECASNWRCRETLKEYLKRNESSASKGSTRVRWRGGSASPAPMRGSCPRRRRRGPGRTRRACPCRDRGRDSSRRSNPIRDTPWDEDPGRLGPSAMSSEGDGLHVVVLWIAAP